MVQEELKKAFLPLNEKNLKHLDEEKVYIPKYDRSKCS